MKTYHVDLVVAESAVTEQAAEHLFDVLQGDVTPATSNGTPLLMCSIDATDFGAAVTATVRQLRDAGYEAESVPAEPDAVAT